MCSQEMGTERVDMLVLSSDGAMVNSISEVIGSKFVTWKPMGQRTVVVGGSVQLAVGFKRPVEATKDVRSAVLAVYETLSNRRKAVNWAQVVVVDSDDSELVFRLTNVGDPIDVVAVSVVDRVPGGDGSTKEIEPSGVQVGSQK